MSDSEDDFMSDKFLSGTQDVRPGLAKTSHERRIMKIENERAEAEAEQQRLRKRKNPAVVEAERREEVLAKPIGEDSKGFALMAKMGFKPGMSLGKKKDENDLGSGIKVPIDIVVRGHRGGLGVESAEVERVEGEKAAAKIRIEAQMKRMKERAKMTDHLMDDYRKRRRMVSTKKQVIGDLIRSRKACAELDLRVDTLLPIEPWFWPSFRDTVDEGADGAGTSTGRPGEEEDEVTYHYANNQPAPKEERMDEMEEEDLMNRLDLITAYLRSAHFYCVWCGCAFSDSNDMDGNCPGEGRADHDEDE